MVSIRKMHPVSLETIFSFWAERDVCGATVFAASGTERGEDFFLGDNRLSLAAGSQRSFAVPYWKVRVKSALTNLAFGPPSELLKTRWYSCGRSNVIGTCQSTA